MFAIVFDLDMESLRTLYKSESYNNAYQDIRKVFISLGFNWQQGSVYFGGEGIKATHCVLAVMELSKRFDWFAGSVRDIRMLKIEDEDDLSVFLNR